MGYCVHNRRCSHLRGFFIIYRYIREWDIVFKIGGVYIPDVIIQI